MDDAQALRNPGARGAALIGAALIGLMFATSVAAHAASAPPDELATTPSSTPSATSTPPTSAPTSPQTAPPVLVPSAVVPPIVLTAPEPLVAESARVEAGAVRSVRRAATEGPTLPATGSGTPLFLVSGLGALAIGALALWWGMRNRPAVDGTEPGSRG